MEYDIKDFLSGVEKRIYERGENYYRDQRIMRLIKDKNDYSALIMGNAWSPYRIDIQLTDANTIHDWDCNCPYDGGEVCKHVVAALLAIEAGEFSEGASLAAMPSAFDSIEDLVANASRDELADLVLDYAEEDPDFYDEVVFVLSKYDDDTNE